MGEKDIAEKVLEDYNDVFADIVNVLFFQGEQIVKPEQLEDKTLRSSYKADGKLREIVRDVGKNWNQDTIRIACLGIENQTDSDADMPLRVISYDGAEYRAQLIRDISSQDGGDDDIISTKKRRDVKRYPVVTLVLYFGYEKPWSSSKSLLDRLTVSDALKPYVQDYRINVFEIAYLTPKQVKLFQSDFRIVADYFVQKRLNHEYKPSPQKMKHVHAVLQMMSIMTGDHRFEDAYNDAIQKEELNMCEVLDRVEKKGYDAGRIAGKIAGKIDVFYHELGMSVSEIAEKLSITESEVQKILDESE